MALVQADQDAEHLRILSILYYVVAGVTALFGCFPILHFVMGAAMLFGSLASEEKGPPALVGGFFMGFAVLWIGLSWTLAAGLVVAGRSLAQRRRYTFCLVIAALIAALCVPLGTILGVFTLVVLMRPSVKEVFQAGA